MRRNILLFTVITLAGGGSALAQEVAPGDSVAESKELQEVVVVGANQTARAGELTFRPTDREKKVSANGYDLLRHMAMPQISVDPSSDKVTTLAGGGVSMFINGQPASDIDVQNLRTKNVTRVDYLEYPSDPQFRGAPYVVNFIVQMPDWGGYTRLSAYTALLKNTSANTNMFTKFIYKKMSYDLYLGWQYNNIHHLGYEKKDIYSLLTPDNEPFELEQTQNADYTRYRNWGIPVNFRASYNSGNFQAQNTVYFTFADMPTRTHKGTMSLEPDMNRDMRFHESYASNNRNAGWDGNFDLALDRGFSLNLWGNLEYSNNNNYKLYETTLNPSNTGIVTNSSEDAWKASVSIRGRKQLNRFHSVSMQYFTNYSDYDIDYTGSALYNTRMKNTNLGGSISYSGYFPINLRLNGFVGLGWIRSNTDGKSNCRLYPSFKVNASYAPTPQHQINLTVDLQSTGSSASYKTADILQSNDFLYITGNPYLKDYSVYGGQVTYTWFPSNKLNLGAVAELRVSNDKVSPFYSHYLNGQAILQSYHNNGDTYFATLGINAIYRPINSLLLQLNAGYQPAKVTGRIHRSIHPIQGRLSASYYVGNFFVSLTGGLGGRSLAPDTGMLYHIKPFYQLRGGWSDGNWNVEVRANNIFNNSWKANRTELVTPLYSQYADYRDGLYHRELTVSVSYTFDYGKKVERGDEIGAEERNNSAILK